MKHSHLLLVLAALLATFFVGWLIGSTSVASPAPQITTSPTAPLQVAPEVEPVEASVPSASVSREPAIRTPVVCPECEKKDALIAYLKSASSGLQLELTETRQHLAATQLQLEWRPFLQDLTRTLTEWQPDELQSVMRRSKLFPQSTDLYLAQGLVQSGQLNPQSLLALAEEAGRVVSERDKALLYSGEQKQQQLAVFDKQAREFVAKLQRQGFGLLAENFRTGVGLN